MYLLNSLAQMRQRVVVILLSLSLIVTEMLDTKTSGLFPLKLQKHGLMMQ